MKTVMKIQTRYTSAVTNQPFLFSETLVLAQCLREGQSWEALKYAVETENLLNHRALATRKNIFQGVSARLKAADPLLIDLLLDSPPQGAKLVNFFLCLVYFRLLREFMAELVLPQTQRGIVELTAFEVQEFFAHKRQQQDVLNRWQDSTFEKVKSNTLRLASDAELLIGPPQGPWQMVRPLLSLPLVQTLKSLHCAAFIPLLGNEV